MSQWTDVASEGDLFEDAGIPVTVQGRDIALFFVKGAVYATDNLCTHGNAMLSDGYMEGHDIECPFHQGKFDVRSGCATAAPCTDPVKVWPVKVEGGRVYLDLSA